MVKQLINACARVESEKGMQHRDLKPSNILKIKGEWYISDFGTSKIIEPSAETQPGNERAHLISNSIKGSPAYMSPQLRYVWERYHRR
jgi:serine/threonine protein kinase